MGSTISSAGSKEDGEAPPEQVSQYEALAQQFQQAVLRAYGLDDGSCGETCTEGETCEVLNPAEKLRIVFQDADLNHDGEIDHSEMLALVERLHMDIPEELVHQLQRNMNQMMLQLRDPMILARYGLRFLSIYGELVVRLVYRFFLQK